MRTAIGLDPSLTGLAICCIAEDGTVRETVLAKSPPHGPTIGSRVSRFRKLANSASDWLLQHAAPGPLLIEGYSFGSNGSAVLTLAEFGCYLRVKLLASGFTPTEVAPGTLKKFCTGKGVGDKVAIAASLARRYDRDFPGGDNQADAFGLAKLCACVLGIEPPETDFQRKVSGDVQQLLKAEQLARPW